MGVAGTASSSTTETSATLGDNLWSSVDDGSALTEVYFWFADAGWSQISDPAYSYNDGVFQVTLTEGMGSSQWQGQCHIVTTLSAKASDAYTLSMDIEADNDLSGMTIKLTDASNDGNYFCADQHDFLADRVNTYTLSGATLCSGDADALKLVLDFGGSPAGTVVKVSNIVFAKELD